jgi:hypothetical protein
LKKVPGTFSVGLDLLAMLDAEKVPGTFFCAMIAEQSAGNVGLTNLAGY